jgi:hypothetical protein
VVDVLPPAGRIRADGLDVSVRVGADPDVIPGRWDDELANPLENLCVRDPCTVRIEVLEAAAAAAPGDPGPRAIGASQAWHAA